MKREIKVFLVMNTKKRGSQVLYSIYSYANRLQAIGHQATQALKINLLSDVLGFDCFLLLDDCNYISLRCPIVLLDPLSQLFVVNVSKEL